MSNCTIQLSNPDISGIGTRSSFYLQCFLSVLLANRSWEDTPTVLWTFVATNLGLTIAAISQAQQQSLTLYEAIEVSNLVWLANFSTWLSLASYARQKKHQKTSLLEHDDFVKYAAVLQTLFSMPLTLYIWATAETFGSSPNCNLHVIYVFFFANINAVRQARIVALVLTSLLMLLYIPMTTSELWRSYGRRKQRKQAAREAAANGTTLPDDNIANGTGRNHLIELDGNLIGIIITQILIFAYLIPCNELYVARNPTDNTDNQWGFGQILSLVITLPSVISITRAFKKHGLGRVTHHQEAQGHPASHESHELIMQNSQRIKAHPDNSLSNRRPVLALTNGDVENASGPQDN